MAEMAAGGRQRPNAKRDELLAAGVIAQTNRRRLVTHVRPNGHAHPAREALQGQIQANAARAGKRREHLANAITRL